MTCGLRWAIGGALAVGATVAIGGLSQVPYAAEAGAAAVVRLAWRARGERVEQCRHLSPEELARLPAHMRREEDCEGRILPYRLVVTLDGNLVLTDTIHGAGAREDRPLYVFRELPVASGRHRVGVTFTREGEPGDTEEHEEAEQGHRAAAPEWEPGGEHAATPARLALDTTLVASPRQIILITYDEDRRSLVVTGGGPAVVSY